MTNKIIIMAIVAAFVTGTLVSGGIAMADGDAITKLTKECSKDPKKDDKIKAHCELLNLVGGLQTQIDDIEPSSGDTVIEVNVDPTPITINAPQGDKGDTGEQGIQGIPGLPGAHGEMGVQGESFTNISWNLIVSTNAEKDKAECTSTKAFLLHLKNSASLGAANVVVTVQTASGGISIFTVLSSSPGGEKVHDSFTIGGGPDDIIKVSVASEGGAFALSSITLQTTESATAGCTLS